MVWVVVDYGNGYTDILNEEEFKKMIDYQREQLKADNEEDEEEMIDYDDYSAEEIFEQFYGEETVLYNRVF